METAELRRRLAENERQRLALSRERNELVVQLEEAEGRENSHDARFARAALAVDLKAMDTLRAESARQYIADYGAVPDQAHLERAGVRLVFPAVSP